MYTNTNEWENSVSFIFMQPVVSKVGQLALIDNSVVGCALWVHAEKKIHPKKLVETYSTIVLFFLFYLE